MEPVVVAILVILLLPCRDCTKNAIFEKKYVGYRVLDKKIVVSKLHGWSTLHCSVVCLTLEQCNGFNFIRDESNEKKVCEFLQSVPDTSQDSNLKLHPFSEIYQMSTPKPRKGPCHESNNPCHESWDCFEVNHKARCFKINQTATSYNDAERHCENDGTLLMEDDTDVYDYIESKPEFASINQVWIWSDNSELEMETKEIPATEDGSETHSKSTTSTKKPITTTKPTTTTECTAKNKNKCKTNKKDKKEKKSKRDTSTSDEEEDHDGNCWIISLNSRISTQVDCNDVHPYICEHTYILTQ